MRAARPEHKWVLYLDDDIELHPGSLADLVAAAEADPHVFMATGEAPGHIRCTAQHLKAGVKCTCALEEWLHGLLHVLAHQALNMREFLADVKAVREAAGAVLVQALANVSTTHSDATMGFLRTH